MQLPGEENLLAERAALLETLDSLTDDEFESGPTLCEGWAPRDVLSHLLGVDTRPLAYVKTLGNVAKGNAAIVDEGRQQSRERLMNRARHWAEHPAPHVRAAAWYLLGDVATHHQDIVRGLGRTRPVPAASAKAILMEGKVLGAKRLLRHRVEPTDGGHAAGRGTSVRGTSEALGMWLAGRRGIEDELEFGDREPAGRG
jgi:uncharacterized protein (TIGR03083 family)